MTREQWIQKLTSRKFWISVTNFVTMLIVAFGGTESDAVQITALIMAGATVLGYLLAEGLVDSRNNSKTTETYIVNNSDVVR